MTFPLDFGNFIIPTDFHWLIFFRGVGWNHQLRFECWNKWLWNVSWTPSIPWWCTDSCTYIRKDACNVKSEYVFEIPPIISLSVEILPVLHPKRSDEGPGIDKWRTTCITGVKPTTNRNKFQQQRFDVSHKSNECRHFPAWNCCFLGIYSLTN